MTKTALAKAKEALAKLLDRGGRIRTPQHVQATFVLRYGSLRVGILSLKDGVWRFEYTPEFRAQRELRPIVGFPDLTHPYTDAKLWPFFAARIPSLEQDAVQDIARKEEIDISDAVQLLRRFGRRSVTNPFFLDPA